MTIRSLISKTLPSFLPLLMLSSFISFPSALAVEIGVEGGLNFSSSSIDPVSVSSPSQKLGTVFGVFMGLGLNPVFDLEFGGFLVNRNIGYKLGALDYSRTYKNLMVPVLARFNLLPVFSLGAGLYYALALGDISSSGYGASAQTYASNGVTTSETGLQFSARAQYPLLPTVKLLGDVRYSMPFSNRSTAATTTTKFRDLMVLVGVSLGF